MYQMNILIWNCLLFVVQSEKNVAKFLGLFIFSYPFQKTFSYFYRQNGTEQV